MNEVVNPILPVVPASPISENKLKKTFKLFKDSWRSFSKTQKFQLIAVLALVLGLPTLLGGVYAVKLYRSGAATPPITPPTSPTPPPNVSPTPFPTVRPTSTPNLNPPICLKSSIPPATGMAPLTVILHGGGSVGSETGFDGYQWGFENNGSWDTAIDINPVTHTYTTPGIYNPVYRIHGVNGIWSVICKYPYQITVLSPTPKPGCGTICQGPDATSTTCPPGLTCYQPPMPSCPPGGACKQIAPVKICRNPACLTNTNCVCGTLTPTPRPIPTPIIRPTPTPQPICRLQFLGICLIR